MNKTNKECEDRHIIVYDQSGGNKIRKKKTTKL